MVRRKNEQRELRDALSSDEAQLIAVHLTMIAAGGLAHAGYWGTVQSEVSL